MPTCRRSSRRFVFSPPTSMPWTRMPPNWKDSSPLIQRSSVLLPEPERPIIATTSPFSTSSETPLSTSSGPKHFRTSRMLTSDIEPTLEPFGAPGQWEAQAEIDQRDQGVDQKRPKRRVIEHCSGLGQFYETDD